MSITSDARANRTSRVLRRPLRSALAAGLIISALVGGSGGVASAQSGSIVNDPLTDPNLSTSWVEGRQPSALGSEVGTFYADDGYHISIHQDLVAGTDIPVVTMPFTGGSYNGGNQTLDAPLQAGGASVNQSIEVDATQVDGGSNNYYGVACRGTNTGQYLFFVGLDAGAGQAGIKKNGSNQENTAVLAYTNVPAADTYHLRADCNGSRLTMFVNGAKVAEARDSDYKSGSVGLLAVTSDASGVDVAFTNLSISRL